MSQCQTCNVSESRTANVNKFFQIEGKLVLVKNIPALVCCQCEEVTFSAETTEKFG